jgi:hypothetical protein
MASSKLRDDLAHRISGPSAGLHDLRGRIIFDRQSEYRYSSSAAGCCEEVGKAAGSGCACAVNRDHDASSGVVVTYLGDQIIKRLVR